MASAIGETNLAKLLSSMEPSLHDEIYVWCTVNSLEAIKALELSEIVSFFRESEGFTVVVKKSFAVEQNLEYTFECKWITLSVHSSLEAVGLTAAFANALKAKMVSCNVVAGYFHDHIFVGVDEATRAMETLFALVEESKLASQ